MRRTDRSVFAESKSKGGFQFHKLFHRLTVSLDDAQI